MHSKNRIVATHQICHEKMYEREVMSCCHMNVMYAHIKSTRKSEKIKVLILASKLSSLGGKLFPFGSLSLSLFSFHLHFLSMKSANMCKVYQHRDSLVSSVIQFPATCKDVVRWATILFDLWQPS